MTNLRVGEVSFASCCVLFSSMRLYFFRKFVISWIFVWLSSVFLVISVIGCHCPSWSSVRILSIFSVKGWVPQRLLGYGSFGIKDF